MANPWSLIGTYPPKELDNYTGGHTSLNVYVDLKNVMTGLFVESVCDEMKANTANFGSIDSTIFQSVLVYSSYWKRYAYQRGMRPRIFINCDIGRSEYHRQIYRDYKLNREISNQLMTSINDEQIMEIRKKNYEIAEKVANRLPDVYFFHLRFLESDFVCHYLIHKKFNDPNILHVITSNDKDMYQTIIRPNIVMICKKRGAKQLVDFTIPLANYAGISQMSVKKQAEKSQKIGMIDSRYIPVIMAIVGDLGDNIPGVSGIGPSRAIDIFSKPETISQLIGSPEELEDRVKNGGKVFLEGVIPIEKMDKLLAKCYLLNDQVTKAYKMISYEMLIYWLENSHCAKPMLNSINETLSKEKYNIIPSPRSLWTGLMKLNDNYLKEKDILPLFGLEEMERVYA